ncbi:MAG: hypothetical protein AABY97_08550, partial [Chloroflexota bacterium]
STGRPFASQPRKPPSSEMALVATEQFRIQLDGRGPLRSQLSPLLSTAEIEALIGRTDHVLAEKRFPVPGPDRPYPWPLV